eukprot:TRINITY_DN915_c0_g1_i2.p1 TRINITY_DN915_c0_g1~~TRINITY_DN915_c0_g1_i2.p1  ORF type:complete len:228 (-),score=53.08 TRINITY_DN915_c0_g1_i2:73-756(-)
MIRRNRRRKTHQIGPLPEWLLESPFARSDERTYKPNKKKKPGYLPEFPDSILDEIEDLSKNSEYSMILSSSDEFLCESVFKKRKIPERDRSDFEPARKKKKVSNSSSSPSKAEKPVIVLSDDEDEILSHLARSHPSTKESISEEINQVFPVLDQILEGKVPSERLELWKAGGKVRKNMKWNCCFGGIPDKEADLFLEHLQRRYASTHSVHFIVDVLWCEAAIRILMK